jgi:hypothetical protein
MVVLKMLWLRFEVVFADKQRLTFANKYKNNALFFPGLEISTGCFLLDQWIFVEREI